MRILFFVVLSSLLSCSLGKSPDEKKEFLLPLGFCFGMTSKDFDVHSKSLQVDSIVTKISTYPGPVLEAAPGGTDSLFIVLQNYKLDTKFLYCFDEPRDSLPINTTIFGFRGFYYFHDKSDSKTTPMALYPLFEGDQLTALTFEIFGCKKEFVERFFSEKKSSLTNSLMENNYGLKDKGSLTFTLKPKLRELMYQEFKKRNN